MDENKNTNTEQSTFEEELQLMKNNLETITRERDALAEQNKRLLETLRGKPIPAEEKTDEFAFLDKIFNKERK